jgi:hypothetical protein
MLREMTQEEWGRLSVPERKRLQDLSDLHPQLLGLEGYRVEVEEANGSRRRFYVGRSAGWKPIHIELARRDSSGGPATGRSPFKSVRKLYRRP